MTDSFISQGVEYKFAKKRRGMMVGFLTFENAEQLKNGVEVLFFPQRSFIEI